MDKGAEVFKNVCCTGKTDMILKINGQLYQIDVKQKTWRPNPSGIGGYFVATDSHRVAEGVWGVAVDPQTKKVSWYRPGGRPRKDTIPPWRCPPGLETYWDD